LVLAETVPDLKIVLVLGGSDGADVILGRPPVEDLKDLKGKRIGVEASGLGFQILNRALDRADLSFKDVQIVRLAGSEHERGYQQQEVDALVTYEPIRSKLLAEGAKTLFDTSQMPGEVIDVLAVHEEVLNQQQSTLQKLVNGWFRAQQYSLQHKQEAAKYAAQRQSFSTEQFLESLKGLRITSLEENRGKCLFS
jgi:NitT/TauT family transport system substrate-binding protein